MAAVAVTAGLARAGVAGTSLNLAWNFAWQVNAALNTVSYLTVNGSVDDPLATWGNALLECVIKRVAPAHTAVLFSYT